MKRPTMVNSDLKIRTKDYALSVIRLFVALSKRTETQILGGQLPRAVTSVGAQYREAIRAKSNGRLAEWNIDRFYDEMLNDLTEIISYQARVGPVQDCLTAVQSSTVYWPSRRRKLGLGLKK